MGMGNRTKKLYLKTFLNSAAHPPSKQQRSVPESISTTGLQAVPSDESLELNHDSNVGYDVVNSNNKNGLIVKTFWKKSSLWLPLCTSMMDSYPQISVNIHIVVFSVPTYTAEVKVGVKIT